MKQEDIKTLNDLVEYLNSLPARVECDDVIIKNRWLPLNYMFNGDVCHDGKNKVTYKMGEAVIESIY